MVNYKRFMIYLGSVWSVTLSFLFLVIWFSAMVAGGETTMTRSLTPPK